MKYPQNPYKKNNLLWRDFEVKELLQYLCLFSNLFVIG
jgi:hypothetical protein